MGRAMRRMVEASIESGVMKNFPKVISPEQARDVPRENLMLLVTGSQGERRAASAQLARGKYQGIELKEGDMFLFSSKTIPGNEKGVIGIINHRIEALAAAIAAHAATGPTAPEAPADTAAAPAETLAEGGDGGS